MDNEINNLLINLLFVILPLFFYQMLCLDKPEKPWKLSNETMLCAFFAASIILCIAFPITSYPGYLVDLRQIPLILGIMYAGPNAGIWLVACLMTARFIFGGNGGVFISLIVVSIVFVICWLFYRKVSSFPVKIKLISLTALAVLSAEINILANMFLTQDTSFEILSLKYLIIQGICMWIASYFIESMLRNTKMRSALYEAEKLHAVSQIAASISHEVRNPLTVTKGFIQMLLLQPNLPSEKKASYLRMSLEELERAQLIITDYLSVAKPQTENDETFAVHEEARQIINVIRPYASMNSVEVRERSIAECYVCGDRGKFQQILINLMKNGVEAMPDGGKLDLQITCQDEQVQIDIIDTGIGMSREQIDRLGTPFYSNKENGTGLGMMLVFNVIHEMEGSVDVKSEVGKGTHFSIAIPQSSD